jgi:fructokinase
MKAQRRVTCVGEVIVDFVSTRTGATLAGTPSFLKNAGGAAANVAVGLTRLGVETSFIGKVGHDPFGTFLKSELRRNGVNTSGLRSDKSRRTRLAFISLRAAGEREFVFWETRPADECLEPADVDFRQIARSHIVHLSSFLLLSEPARSTVLEIARNARRSGTIVSFDPNLRIPLWPSRQEATHWLLTMTKLSTILRLNEAEARFITNSRTLSGAGRRLLELGPHLVVITVGRKGCYAFTHRASVFSAGFGVRAFDTTGCGDSFLAALLFGILKKPAGIDDLTATGLESICRFANAAGALTATKFGGIPALPTRSQVGVFLKGRRPR